MSVIEDSRKVLQDFIAPELLAISARLDALEKRLDERFNTADKRTDTLEKKIDRVEERADKRHEELMSSMRQIIDYNSIQQRVARLESKDTAHQ